MNSSKEALRALAQDVALQPQEEMIEVGRRQKRLQIGIPRETSYQENRDGLVTD